MKIRIALALLSITSISSISYANEEATDNVKCSQEIKEPHFYEYHNRVILFAPLHQGYERIKPHAFYVGIEGVVNPILNQKLDAFLINGELRMGYNYFFKGRDHMTPFIGAGFLQTDCTHHHMDLGYGTLGFLYDHEFNTIFNLGLNGKLLMGSPTETKHHSDWGSFVVGSNVSLPITFRFGRHRHWDYRLEPFNIYLHGSNRSRTFWGFNNSIGYRF